MPKPSRHFTTSHIKFHWLEEKKKKPVRVPKNIENPHSFSKKGRRKEKNLLHR